MARKWSWSFKRETPDGPVYAHGVADDQQNSFMTLDADQADRWLNGTDIGKAGLVDELTVAAEAAIAPPPPPVVPEDLGGITEVDADEAAARLGQLTSPLVRVKPE